MDIITGAILFGTLIGWITQDDKEEKKPSEDIDCKKFLKSKKDMSVNEYGEIE